ncbi:MAG: TlpA disulfide reductase family protein [Gallionella sp.]
MAALGFITLSAHAHADNFFAQLFSKPASASQKELVAPDCALATLSDKQTHTLNEFRGKVLYVDFWASWCGPCAQAFPFLNTTANTFRDRGLQVVGINVDEHADDANKFLHKHPADFLIVADAKAQCPKDFAVMGMPSSYLIDRKGVIRYTHLGFRQSDTEQLKQQIEQLLAEGNQVN